MIASTGSLRAAVALYALERGRTGRSLENLHHVLNSFEKWLGRESYWPDLTTDNLIGWGLAQFTAKLDPETIRSRRTTIIGIWRWGHGLDYITSLPGRLPKIKVPDKPPECWDKTVLKEKVIDAATKIPGRMRRDRKIRRAMVAEAWMRAGYSTGFRFDDLHHLRRDAIADSGLVAIVQAKTGNQVVGHLNAKALAAVRRILSDNREHVFCDLINRRNLQGMVRQVVTLAGVKGSTKWLRRTGATWCEIETPGSAMQFLGHKTPGLAWKHYIDPRFVQKNKPQPPPLD